MKAMQERDARLTINECFEEWKRGNPPSDETDLKRALLCLIKKRGVERWISANQDALSDDSEVLHGAGFRKEEMAARAAIVILEFEGRTLYVRPHHGDHLRQLL